MFCGKEVTNKRKKSLNKSRNTHAEAPTIPRRPLFTLPPRQYRDLHCRSRTPTQLQTVIGSWSLASDPHPLCTTTSPREMVSDQVDSVDKGIGLGRGGGGLTLRECQCALVLTFSCCCTLKPSFYIFHSDITAEPLLHTLRCVDCIKMGGPVVPASSQSQNAMCFLVSTTITKHFPSHVPLSKMIHICFTLTHLNISAQCQLV